MPSQAIKQKQKNTVTNKTANKKREFYLDLLKFIALICMVFIHSATACLEVGAIEESAVPTAFINTIYIFAPTIFMFAMGVCIQIKKADSKSLLKRGLIILLVGFILNVLRASTLFIKGIIDIENRSEYFIGYVDWLVGSDILYFAGLFYIYYALIQKLKLNKYVSLLIAIIFLIIGNVLIGRVSIENEVLDMFIGNFIYLDGGSYFPILLWTIFPTLGIFFESFFEKIKNKDKFMAIIGLSGFVIVCLLFAIMVPTNTFEERYIFFGLSGFKMDVLTTLFILCINAFYIMVIYYLAKPLDKISNLNKFVTLLSSNLTNIYFVHWILYMYLFDFIFYFASYKITQTIHLILFALLILIISPVLGILLGKLIKKIKLDFNNKKYQNSLSK